MKRALLALAAIVSIVGCAPEPGTGGSQPAVEFSVLEVGTNEKTRLSLSELKGKVVLVDVWATWCGPCKALTPTIDKAYDDYKDKGLVVVAVSDESEATLLGYHQRTKPPYPFYRDVEDDVYRGYKVRAIPRTLIIGRDGTLLEDIEGADPEGLRAAIDRAMG